MNMNIEETWREQERKGIQVKQNASEKHHKGQPSAISVLLLVS